MKLSEARKYRAVIETAMNGTVGDAEALEVPELFPRWDSTGSYETGKRVRHEGVLYKCLQPHQAQADWTPAAAPSLWARVLIPDENVIPEWVQPESTNGYSIGDKVRHNGTVWVSDCDGNIWEPGIYGWTEVRS